MKRNLLTILACAMACMTSFAQLKQVYFDIEADIELSDDYKAYYAIDEDFSTYWITADPEDSERTFPREGVSVLLKFGKITHVNFVRYTPPPFGSPFYDGNWKKVKVSYCSTKDGEDFIDIKKYTIP